MAREPLSPASALAAEDVYGRRLLPEGALRQHDKSASRGERHLGHERCRVALYPAFFARLPRDRILDAVESAATKQSTFSVLWNRPPPALGRITFLRGFVAPSPHVGRALNLILASTGPRHRRILPNAQEAEALSDWPSSYLGLGHCELLD